MTKREKALRQLLDDCLLYLLTAEQGWKQMQGTPWFDGLQRIIGEVSVVLEAADSDPEAA
jgi:hypothetical protein